MSKNKKITLGVVGLVVILLMGVSAFYFIYLGNFKNLFVATINEGYERISDYLNKDSLVKLDEDKIALNSNIKISSSEDLVYTRYNYDFNLGLDKNSKLFYTTINAKDKDNNILSGNLMLNEDNGYITIPELYNKTIVISQVNEFWNNLTNSKINNKDYDYIIKSIKDSFIKNIKKEDFTNKNVKETVNNKEMNLNKVTFKPSQKRTKEILENIINDISKDTKSKEIIANMLNIKEDEVKDKLKSNLNDLKINSLEINLYTKRFSKKVIKGEIIQDKDKLTIDNYNNITNIYLDNDSNNSINLTIDESKKNIKVSYNNHEYMTINIKEYNDTKLNADFVLKIENEAFKGNVLVTAKKESDTKVNYIFKTSLKNQKDEISLEGTMSLSNELNKIDIDTTNVININDFNETELNTLYMNLLNNKFILDMVQVMQ